MTIAVEKFRTDLPPAAARWNGFPPHDFVGGHNDPDGVPVDALQAALAAAFAREARNFATYKLTSGSLGHLPLRAFLSDALKRRAGIEASPDEILLTSGSLQALDLVNEAYLSPGDIVIIEEGSYGGAYSRLRRLGVEMIAAPLDDDGLTVDGLAAILDQLSAQGRSATFLYTIPTVQNPTGSVLPLERRHRILELAAAHNCLIFEDDCYADLTFDGARPPAFRALNTDRVVYCGSFSKTIAPALRVGYVVADWPVLAQLVSLKTDAGSPALEQIMLGEFCPRHFDDHVDRLRLRLKGKHDVIVEAVEREFGAAAEIAPAKGGIFVWLTLDAAVDTTELAALALAQGVSINPGGEWMASPAAGRDKLRLCFAKPSREEIETGVAKLAAICRERFGVPKTSANVRA